MQTDESIPLLVGKRKPFYRARPLWLVPFAITAALVRGMTLAPRLEVFTQLSCNRLYGHHEWNHTQSNTPNFSSSSNTPFVAPINLGLHTYPYPGVTFIPHPNHRNADMESQLEDDDTADPRRIPSARCLSDPAVQAGAARLQTLMTTTMGLLSALTTGWWGHFSERHGRTRVLALSTLGLFLTDLMFILVSTPSSLLSKHGHILLLVSPIIEGLLGGYATLQSASSAYLSDCTSSGSRAHIFSRFTGAVALGFSVGPAFGGWLIRHPLGWLEGPSMPGRQTVTSVFWVAVFCSFVNLLLITFVFPESLDDEKRERAMMAYRKMGGAAGKKGKTRERAPTLSYGDLGSSSTDEEDSTEDGNSPREEERVRSGAGIIGRFLSPLAVFLPVVVLDSSGLGRKRRDWSLTLLAGALFGYMLSTGISQIKYRYAEHTYEWGADQLSYYISFMGMGRAMFLLLLLPTVISFFKPKPLPPIDTKGKGKPPVLSNSNKTKKSTSSLIVHQPQPPSQPHQKGKKPKPSRAQLGQEIGFDLLLTRISLMIDVLSNTLTILFPAPPALKLNNNFESHVSFMQAPQGGMSFEKSQALFVFAATLNSLGSGAVPAVHSLALCMLQVRAMDAVDGESGNAVEVKEEGTGALFGAFAVLQAVGQTIIGPLIFGLVYSGTVAKFPKAIFTVAAGVLTCSLAMVVCVRNPVRTTHLGRSQRRTDRQGRDVERGRSRISKDLRGGAIANYGSDSRPS